MSVSKIVGPYIEKEYYETIRNYKYTGGDNSIFYKYCMSPFCNWIVEKYVPLWMAPNVLTVAGFFLNLAYSLVAIYFTGLGYCNNFPSWICYFGGFCYLTYNVLDNCDGKQARKTKSSSPLGMLVDHGTDATTTFWISLGFGSFNYYGWEEYMLNFFLISFAFFLNTWEEYITGALYLPIIHGVSEGTILVVGVEILSGIFGEKLITKKLNILGIQLQINQALVYFALICGLFYGIASIVKVCLKTEKKKVIPGLIDTFILVLFDATYFSVFYISDSVYAKEKPKLLLLTFGFGFAKIMSMMQMAHLKNARYKPYTFGVMVPIITLLGYSLIYKFTGFNFYGIVTIDQLISVFFVWNLVSWCHYCWFVSDEMCEILNIKRFSLGPRHSDDKKSQ